MKKPALLSLLILLSYLAYTQWTKWEKKERRGNTLSEYMLVDVPNTQEDPSEDVQRILQVPYYYVACGRQAVVFSSIDEKYVLKLMKWPKEEKKQKELLTSLHLAQTALSSESGIVAIHHSSKNVVTAMDRRGKMVFIDLSHALFAIQKRAPLRLKETLLKLQWENKIDEATQVIEALFSLLSSMRSKGVLDRDGALIRNDNIGLLKHPDGGYTALSIDIGRYSLQDRDKITQNDIKRLRPLALWIGRAWPELLSIYQKLELEYRRLSNNQN